MNFIEELEARGLVKQNSDPQGLKTALEKPLALYCGFDPTADSLHVGSLLPLLTLRRFQLAGHKVIALVGGATGLIGDPSGKAEERKLTEKATVEAWVARIRGQIGKLLDLHGVNKALVVDNYEWINALSLIGYLRDVGKHFPLGGMLAKDSVKSRMEAGISYTEFSYMVLQAYDFLHLHRHHGCKLQIGGSDQWGNMTAGIELIRRMDSVESYALTMPLITTADGKKFGKTEAGAVWLDSVRTSPYAFYQFWLNADDRDVIPYLKYFTFLPLSEISAIEESFRKAPEKREAQQKLAWEVTKLLHGEEEAKRAKEAAQVLFGQGDLMKLDAKSIEQALESAPKLKLAPGPVPALHALLTQSGFAKSKGEVRRLIEGGGLYVNEARVDNVEHQPKDEDFIQGRLLIVRVGKKKYLLVQK